MHVEVVRLVLELEPGSEPIKGWLTLGHGERRGFHGWMELAATLEALNEEGAATTQRRYAGPPKPPKDR